MTGSSGGLRFEPDVDGRSRIRRVDAPLRRHHVERRHRGLEKGQAHERRPPGGPSHAVQSKPGQHGKTGAEENRSPRRHANHSRHLELTEPGEGSREERGAEPSHLGAESHEPGAHREGQVAQDNSADRGLDPQGQEGKKRQGQHRDAREQIRLNNRSQVLGEGAPDAIRRGCRKEAFDGGREEYGLGGRALVSQRLERLLVKPLQRKQESKGHGHSEQRGLEEGPAFEKYEYRRGQEWLWPGVRGSRRPRPKRQRRNRPGPRPSRNHCATSGGGTTGTAEGTGCPGRKGERAKKHGSTKREERPRGKGGEGRSRDSEPGRARRSPREESQKPNHIESDDRIARDQPKGQ